MKPLLLYCERDLRLLKRSERLLHEEETELDCGTAFVWLMSLHYWAEHLQLSSSGEAALCNYRLQDSENHQEPPPLTLPHTGGRGGNDVAVIERRTPPTLTCTHTVTITHTRTHTHTHTLTGRHAYTTTHSHICTHSLEHIGTHTHGRTHSIKKRLNQTIAQQLPLCL